MRRGGGDVRHAAKHATMGIKQFHIMNMVHFESSFSCQESGYNAIKAFDNYEFPTVSTASHSHTLSHSHSASSHLSSYIHIHPYFPPLHGVPNNVLLFMAVTLLRWSSTAWSSRRSSVSSFAARVKHVISAMPLSLVSFLWIYYHFGIYLWMSGGRTSTSRSLRH